MTLSGPPQELKDVRDGQRILEKKGSAAVRDPGGLGGCPEAGVPRRALTPHPSPLSMCVSPPPQLKDLKRQLQLERRRADRLQERLQELLAPSRSRTGQPDARVPCGVGEAEGGAPRPRGALWRG